MDKYFFTIKFKKMGRTKWQKYYTRPTCLQDFEVPVVLPLFYLSKNRVKKAAYVPLQGEEKWEGWYVKKEFEGFLESLGREVFKKSWTLKKHKKRFKQRARDLYFAAKILNKTSGRTSYKQLLENYQGLYKSYLDYGLFIWQPWSITTFLEKWFIGELRRRYKRWEDIYEIIALSSKATQYQLMIEAVWRWKAKGGIAADLEKIVKKFAFLGAYSVNDPVWGKVDILKQVGSLWDCEHKLSEAIKERRRNRRRFEQVVKKLKKENYLVAKVAEVIHEYLWLRNERVDKYKQAMVLSQPFYRRLEKEFGWKRGWAAHLTYQEIIGILKGDTEVTVKELEKRHKLQYVAYMTPQKTTIIADIKERQKFLDKLLIQVKLGRMRIVKGQIACPGKVRGRVRLILRAGDAQRLKKGEILVANMTHPDYIIAVRNASAIITDEGGVVCHAAIISREFKKPCIIGTKIATKVLKDGQLVEVDANKGTVKILK